MRTWRRAQLRVRCGRCGTSVPRGEPMLVIEILAEGYAIASAKFRCAACADEPVPPLDSLPALLEPSTTIAPSLLVRGPRVARPKAPPRQQELAAVGDLATDWKSKQSGDA